MVAMRLYGRRMGYTMSVMIHILMLLPLLFVFTFPGFGGHDGRRVEVGRVRMVVVVVVGNSSGRLLALVFSDVRVFREML